MNFSSEQVERLRRLYDAWAEAEKAIKIADQTVGDIVIPAIKELRYAGRKLSKSINNYISGTNLADADRWLEDAINDCFRARHDATDAATAFITLRLEQAITELGNDAVREHFPEYSDLRGLLSSIRQKVANSRFDHNGRHDIYEDIELDELPRIMELYEKFLANEPYMKSKKFKDWLKNQGLTWGFFIMLAVTIYKTFYNG